MGGSPGPNGAKLQFFDAAGNVDATRPTIQHPCCFVTAQAQGTPGVGSGDWLKEIYLAPDNPTLYALLRTFPPKGTPVPFTSASSQNVTVSYIDANGKMISEQWKSVIGLGTDTTVTLGDGTQQPLRLFDTFQLTQGDLAVDPANALAGPFKHNSTAGVQAPAE